MIKCHDDLVRRTQDIKPESRVSAYIGGLGSRGSRGIESTQGQFIIFDVLNIKNVVDETNQKGSVMIDKEQLLVWDPEFIFIDLNGLVHVNEDYNSNPEFYQALSAYKNKNVYGQLPFNFLTTNIDTALVNTYFIGKTVYPDAFKDINAVVKADEIYTILLGEPFYEKMVRDFGGFHKIEGLQ